jgi:hypothetical protein
VEEEEEVRRIDKRLEYDSISRWRILSRCCEESLRRVARMRTRRGICHNRLSIMISHCNEKDEEISNIAAASLSIWRGTLMKLNVTLLSILGSDLCVCTGVMIKLSNAAN